MSGEYSNGSVNRTNQLFYTVINPEPFSRNISMQVPFQPDTLESTIANSLSDECPQIAAMNQAYQRGQTSPPRYPFAGYTRLPEEHSQNIRHHTFPAQERIHKPLRRTA